MLAVGKSSFNKIQVQANQSQPQSQLQLRKAEINARSTHWMCAMKQKVTLTNTLLFCNKALAAKRKQKGDPKVTAH